MILQIIDYQILIINIEIPLVRVGPVNHRLPEFWPISHHKSPTEYPVISAFEGLLSEKGSCGSHNLKQGHR